MEDEAGSGAGQFDVKELMLSIGWHLAQGEELSRSYAEMAEQAKDDDAAAFFRSIQESYRSALDLSANPSAPFGNVEWGWGRPPYR